MSPAQAPRYDALIGKLDLATKVRLLTGATLFTLHGEESIGLAPMAFSDGPTGVRGLRLMGTPPTCLLPNASLLAATWDLDLMAEAGALLGDEARRMGIHVVLGPTINLHRSPLGGRLFEAFSEDPLLTGKLAAAYVRGMQTKGVAACLKHLVANESETERNFVNSVVDEAALREIYLLPFEIAIAESDPWTVMAAYNDVNGVPATEQHHVITEILKQEWGYPGLVMSDWFATKSSAPAANAGLDLVMPGPQGPWGEHLVADVRAGAVAESTIDDHIRRLLHLASRVGALGETQAPQGVLPMPDDPQRREQVTRLAASGMTVLVNDAVLPLANATRVALIGRHAIDTVLMGGGSASVTPPYLVSIAEGLAADLPPSRLRVVDGVEVRARPVLAAPSFVTDPVNGQPGMRLTLFASDGRVLEERHLDDARTLVGLGLDFSEPLVAARMTARISDVGRIRVGAIGVGSWVVSAGGERREAVLTVSGADPGEAIFKAPSLIFDIDVSEPGGVIEADVDLSGVPVTVLALVARPAPRPVADAIAEAVDAARDADVAVVVVGTTEEQETESLDKTTLSLPGEQDALVSAVAKAARKTVVVLNAATPVLMPWLGDVSAVLFAGLPGQDGGHAVAAALLGRIEPAGRLVTTFPAADGASAAWSVTPIGGVLPYTEGAFIGYRGHFDGRAPAPAFWFGHGLGYGAWDYTGLSVSRSGGVPIATVSLRNTSSYDSREVVQVYFKPSDADQPARLVGWAAVSVCAGEAASVEVACEPQMWRRWDSGTWGRVGQGEIIVARGLGDIRLRAPIA